MREFIQLITLFSILTLLLPVSGLFAEDKNHIEVQVALPSGTVLDLEEVVEGQAVEIVGLTFPFQYLNGGKLLFPEESLNENITLTIEVPDFASLTDNAVNFGDEIASAVRFTVSKDGEEISPYHFEKPVEVTLPIPESLPSTIGDQVSTFVLAYRDTEGNFDTTSVRTRVRDEVESILTAEVDHFSDIVMVPSRYIDSPTSIEEERQIPMDFALYQNYPNPFNPETTIRYDIAERTNVTLTIYNTLGQEVKTLVDETKAPGQYSAVFDAGSLPSGIYIASLKTSSYTATVRMVLLK